MSQNIFINYRREDTAGHAGWLFDRLSSAFPGRVFMDIDTLEPGIDFVEAIEQAVGSCEVLIVLIGHEWLSRKNAAGHQRLDDPEDFVRLEVATALQRNIRVIPVLVQGAPMPRAEQLPPDLAKLARRNAIELSDARWAYDVDRLIHTVTAVLKGSEPGAPVAAIAEPKDLAPAGRPVWSKAWIALLAAVVLSGALWTGWKTGKQRATQLVAMVTAAALPTESGKRQVATGKSEERRIDNQVVAAPIVHIPALESTKSPRETKKQRVGTREVAVPPAHSPALEKAKRRVETKQSKEQRVDTRKREAHSFGTKKREDDVIEINDITIHMEPALSSKPENNKPPPTA